MYAQTKKIVRRLPLLFALPCASLFVMEWCAWRKEQAQPRYQLAHTLYDLNDLKRSKLLLYPIDMKPLLALPFGTLDEKGVLYNARTRHSPATYQPTSIAQYALAHWNAYLTTGHESHKDAFLTQARWLAEHETSLTPDTSGWRIPFPAHTYHTTGPWLSALTQGNCISVLVRAYSLTGEDGFLQVARRALRTFETDIQDGGVSSFVDGIFFEEVAAYPAAHILNGYILALFGLYDYVALTGDTAIAALIQRSLETLHTLIDDFDTGYWSRYDLHVRSLASPFYHALHSTLLQALSHYSGCEHCAMLATRWTVYQQRPLYQLRYFSVSRLARYGRGFTRILSKLIKTQKEYGHTCMGNGYEYI